VYINLIEKDKMGSRLLVVCCGSHSRDRDGYSRSGGDMGVWEGLLWRDSGRLAVVGTARFSRGRRREMKV